MATFAPCQLVNSLTLLEKQFGPFYSFLRYISRSFFSSFAAAAAVYIIKTRMTQDLPHDLLAVRACIPLPFSFFCCYFSRQSVGELFAAV